MTAAGWIPPEFRKSVTVELTDEELRSIRESMWITDGEGNVIQESDEEIRAKVKRTTGVIDLRDGSYHPNRYFKD